MNIKRSFHDFFSYIFASNKARVDGAIGPIPPAPNIALSNADASMRLSAVFACVRILSETIACLPKKIYDSKTNKEFPQHPLNDILNHAPNSYQSGIDFWNFCLHGLYLRGNGFAIIERNNGGGVRLRPLNPINISGVKLETDINTGDIQKIFQVNGQDVSDNLMLHFMGSAPDQNGMLGISVIERYAMNSVNHLHAIDEFSTTSFKRGANINGVYKVPQALGDEDRKMVRKELDSLHSGMSAGGRFAIADAGATIDAITLSPDDSKYIGSKNFGIEDICRFFGVPLHLVQNGQQQSYNSNEQNGSAFLTFTLLPQCMRIEQQINRKLFPMRDYYCAFDFTNLIRPSIKDRYESNLKATGGPFMTVNECRKLENLPSIEGGDVLLKPLNMGAKMNDDIGDKPNGN